MPSECTLGPAVLAGIGDARIRQRMEACQQGIVQLDSLRQKHNRLMEQLRSQYPDFIVPPHTRHLPIPVNERPSVFESATLPATTSSALPVRSESPLSSACMSHRSSVSIDSGYTSLASDPFLSCSPMSYSAYRKKASTLERSTAPAPAPAQESTSCELLEATFESTAGLRPGRISRRIQHRDDTSWQRPRSMYATVPQDEQGEDAETGGAEGDKVALAGVSVAATARKLLDASSFAQITPPPPVHRKFATLTKTPPKPLPRSIFPNNPSSASSCTNNTTRSLSASSSALHHSSPVRVGGVSKNVPVPQFATFEACLPSLQSAKVYSPAPAPTLAPSATSAFHSPAKGNGKAGGTPPTKPRYSSSQPPPGAGTARSTFIVPILASAKEALPPRLHHHHRLQAGAVGPEASPMEVRKVFLATPHTISRYGSSPVVGKRWMEGPALRPDASPSRSRREKIWHESEGL